MYVLDFAEIPTQQLQREWGTLSQEKADEAMRTWTREGLKFQSGGQTLTPLHEGTEIELSDGASGLKVARVTAMLRLPAALGSLDYVDHNFEGRAGWKEIVITDEAPAHVTRASHSRRDISRGLTRYQLDLTPPHDLRARLEWTLDGNAAERIVTAIPQPPPPAVNAQRDNTEGQDRLSALLREKNLPWHLLVLALALAFGLGALHALEPGHGKTIVAAYLVGTRGTWKHAIYLGAIVTFTHVFSVFVLGLLTLFAARYWPPERIFPILSVASGLSIAGLGLWLLWQRWHGLGHHRHHHGHGRSPGHDHSHDHPHDDDHSRDHDHSHDRQHNHSPKHDHHHHHSGHSGHEHLHQQSHEHEHADHHHDHEHSHHHNHAHHHHPPDNVTMGNLLALGISGGIVPCPAAMVLLLSCIGMGRIALGLGLLGAFSLGLAIVLTAIGLLVLFAKEKLPAGDHTHGWTEYLPVFSALAITLVGAVITARALGWI